MATTASQTSVPWWYTSPGMGAPPGAAGVGQQAGQVVSGFLGAVPSLSGLTGANTLDTSGITGAEGGVTPMTMPDMTGSNNATFAAAKDKVGQISRASLDSLAGEFGATGRLGSGADTQATRDTIMGGAGQLGDVVRGQAQNDAATKLDVAKTNYAGAQNQRGQNIQAEEAKTQMQMTAAAQQRQQLSSLMNSILGGLVGSGQTTSMNLY